MELFAPTPSSLKPMKTFSVMDVTTLGDNTTLGASTCTVVLTSDSPNDVRILSIPPGDHKRKDIVNFPTTTSADSSQLFAEFLENVCGKHYNVCFYRGEYYIRCSFDGVLKKNKEGQVYFAGNLFNYSVFDETTRKWKFNFPEHLMMFTQNFDKNLQSWGKNVAKLVTNLLQVGQFTLPQPAKPKALPDAPPCESKWGTAPVLAPANEQWPTLPGTTKAPAKAPTKAPAPAHAKVSAPAHAKAPAPVPAQDTLEEWLANIRLSNLCSALNDLGATVPVDLLDIDEDDVASLNLKSLEKKRLFAALSKLQDE